MSVRLIAMSGSLRSASYNTALLRAAQLLSPPDVAIEFCLPIEQLPHFNPDLDDDPPGRVIAFRKHVGDSDGVLIACPEYARGVPGAFKNALDWLVGSPDFPDKPVALFNASQRSTDAQAALRLILTTMSAKIVEEASITVPLLGEPLNARSIATHEQFGPSIQAAILRFVAAVSEQGLAPRHHRGC